MVHLALVAAKVTADESAELFLDVVFQHHGLPDSIVSDHDPRFTSAFWTRLFALLGTRLLMSTAAHPETDGQTVRVNRVLGDVLRSYATSFTSWSSILPMAEFALNNATHAPTGLTPFFVNNARQPRVPELLAVRSPHAAPGSALGGGGRAPTSQSVQESSEPPLPQSTTSSAQDATVQGHALHGVAYEESLAVDAAAPAASIVATANFAPKPTPTPIDCAAVSEILLHRQAVMRFVRDAIQVAVDLQKANADRRGRKNMSSVRRGERVLLSTDGIKGTAVTNLGASKLAPRFKVPFKNLKVVGNAYTLDIPTAMRLHPTFYVGRLKPYVPVTIPAPVAERPQPAPTPSDEAAPASRVAPAPTDSQQTPPQQHAREQTQRGSEPPSRRLSPGQSPTSSTGTVEPTDAPRRQSARSQAALQQTRYQRNGPPPFVDATGARRYVVECLVDHDTRAHRENPPRGNPNSVNTRSNRRQAPERYYRVRWLGHSPVEGTWEPRSRLLEDVPDLVSDKVVSLDCDATARARDFANDCASGPARASHGDYLRGSPQLQDPCEPDHSARATVAHLRSASRSSLDAPTPRASAADDLGTWRSLRPGARTTDDTRAVPTHTRAPEVPQ
ncbi:unnamed protein product [Phytophthora fragariaefolia]|uniref:Unnamed protein product n=1 Tax=Phytophthora fragariaefolia TaxID=1490495 RepID=A0A9W7CUP9_9STRA|nr:unnamed protein product [Phytophthora fragariaefolia]